MRQDRHSAIAVAAYLIVFAGVGVLSQVLAAHAHRPGELKWREAAAIMLFIPLIWSFLWCSPAGMTAAFVAISILRVRVEWLQMQAAGVGATPAVLAAETVFPVALYLALGITIYLYRLRQEFLTRQLLQASALEIRQQMASRLAHDFNNVLTVVSGTAQLMKADVGDRVQLERDAESILQASEQGMALVRQMMSLSRDLPDEKAACELSGAISQQMEMIRRLLPERVQVVQECASDPLIVRADGGKLLRILTNLCLNAAQAMPEGGTLTLRTARKDGSACLVVEDTGTGIDPRDLGRIFKPFFTTRGPDGGTGLGLSIVHSLVEEHGGRISVSSTPGRGTRFEILLPLETASGPA